MKMQLSRATRLRKRVRGVVAALFGLRLEIHRPPAEHEVLVWIETPGARVRFVRFHRMLWPRQAREISNQIVVQINAAVGSGKKR